MGERPAVLETRSVIRGTLSAGGRQAEAGWGGVLVLRHRCRRNRLNVKVGRIEVEREGTCS